MLLTRAWFVAHRGPAGLVAGVIASVLFALFGTVSIQLWGTERELPLWAVAPGTLTMIVCTGLENRLGHLPAARPSWVRIARMLWAFAIIGFGVLLAVPTALALGDTAIATATGLLVVVSFGPALLDVRLAVAVGAVVDGLAVLYGGRVVADREMSSVLADVPAWLWLALVVPGVLGMTRYVLGDS